MRAGSTFIRRRRLLAGAGAVVAMPAIAPARAQTPGVALVIGNSKYQWEASLPNVRRDAPDIAKRFQAMGLKTELVQDANRAALEAALAKFKAAAGGAPFAAFYFAGHGVSWEKDTYIVPVDVDLGSPGVVKTLVRVAEIGAAMKGAANRLLVFDNCRNNPADGWRQQAAERQSGVNLDKLRADTSDAQANSLTLYSTAPGRVALDGPAGDNSPFAAAFLRQFGGASVDIPGLPARLRRDLLIATGGRQVVWDQSTYRQPFALGRRGGGADVAAGPAPSVDPARLVEIRNAYVFAKQNGLPLPEGLIGIRPAGNSPHAQKIGSFVFTAKTPVGPTPYLFVVLSVDDRGTAELVTTIQNDSGRVWRYVTGTVTGNRLSFVPNYGRPNYLVDWSDANSGSVGSVQRNDRASGGSSNSLLNASFKRLD